MEEVCERENCKLALSHRDFISHSQWRFRLARGSEIDCRSIASPTEPPGTDPYAGWGDSESGFQKGVKRKRLCI